MTPSPHAALIARLKAAAAQIADERAECQKTHDAEQAELAKQGDPDAPMPFGCHICTVEGPYETVMREAISALADAPVYPAPEVAGAHLDCTSSGCEKMRGLIAGAPVPPATLYATCEQAKHDVGNDAAHCLQCARAVGFKDGQSSVIEGYEAGKRMMAVPPATPVCERCKGTGFEADPAFVCVWCHGHGAIPPATCPTHGDPLVCVACEQDEDARPEWRAPDGPRCATHQALKLADAMWDRAMEIAAEIQVRLRHGLTGQGEIATPIFLALSASPPPLTCHWCTHPQNHHVHGEGTCIVYGCPCVRFVLPEPPLSEPAWDIQEMCEGCKTAVHCAHHRRCLAECVPADLIQSLQSEPVLRDQAEAWLLQTGSQHQGRLNPDDLVAFVRSLQYTAPVLTLHYSGAASKRFWAAINATGDEALYARGCALQDLEQQTLAAVQSLHRPPDAPGEAEKKEK